MTLCKVKICDRENYCNGYCRGHYNRIYFKTKVNFNTPIRTSTKLDCQKIIDLYKNGLGVGKISQLIGYKKNSIIYVLKYKKLLKRALGRDIEEEVAKWFEKKGLKVERQPGDSPFDLLILSEKIDVKSARLSKDNRYRFEIQHTDSLPRNKKNIDWFYLVFKSGNYPIYKLQSEDINVKCLNILTPQKSKYPLIFVGYLRKRGE